MASRMMLARSDESLMIHRIVHCGARELRKKSRMCRRVMSIPCTCCVYVLCKEQFENVRVLL